MDYAKQRVLGLQLAKAGKPKWEKTQATIEHKDSCFEDIFKIAVAEGGVDAVVARILEGPPEWAYRALRHIPNPGTHRDALLKKAAEDPEWALHTLRFVPDLGKHSETLVQKAGALAQPIGSISGMNLLNQGGYVCQWTLNWTNAGLNQPKASYPSWDDWVWSERLDLGQSSGRIDLAKFALPKAPLQAGNTVWMYVWVQAGIDMTSAVQFTYDPNNPLTANFTVSGTTTKDHLGYEGTA